MEMSPLSGICTAPTILISDTEEHDLDETVIPDVYDEECQTDVLMTDFECQTDIETKDASTQSSRPRLAEIVFEIRNNVNLILEELQSLRTSSFIIQRVRNANP